MLKIFDQQYNQIGVATRDEVHRIGHWHEAFHCWFFSRKGEEEVIYLQIRSQLKKDYPNLLDITAAGHLLADETIKDGIREIEEEIGVEVSFDALISAGVYKYAVEKGNFIDKELAHIYLFETDLPLHAFTLQKEEVSGIVQVKLTDFYELWLGEKEEVNVQGFEIENTGNRILLNKTVNRTHFVPHERGYYEHMIKSIQKISAK
nr:NUDIX domain-containing protein [Cytobacillus eiseniae]